ncbi:MAG: hypothetical protein JO152_07810, partial [Mycobacteriaceae bacterium]|nr:hypothetical protein [Mycobacteriaceae bacterium]
MDRSVRYAGAGCLIAIGLLIGGSAGVAIAEPSGAHHGENAAGDGHRGGINRGGPAGPTHLPGFGGTTYSNPTHRRGDGPRTTVGDGRKPGSTVGSPTRSRDSTVGQQGNSDGRTKGDDTGDHSKPDGGDETGKPDRQPHGWLCPPRFRFPLLFTVPSLWFLPGVGDNGRADG